MTQIMNEQQSAEIGADAFRHALRILDTAACGVIMVRTSEPYRAAEAIKNLSYSLPDRRYGHWSVNGGWEIANRTSISAEPKIMEVASPIQALNMMEGTDDDAPFGNGFYTFMYPHFWLRDNVGQRVPMIHLIKKLSQVLPTGKVRLIMLVPPAYSLPPEIVDDVVVLDFSSPSFAELKTCLDTFIKSLGPKKPRLTTAETARVVSAGMGMSQQEFESAVARAIVTHKALLPNLAADLIVSEVMKVKTEVVKRSEVLEVMPAQPMSDIGGLDLLKDWVTKRSHCFSDEAKAFGVEAPKGCGLVGPPGTGKSLSAKAIASSLGLPLIKFDMSSVFQSLVGQSEERVKTALKMLDSMAPCVVLLDEIDKMFTSGGNGDSGVSQRVLGAVLTHMQESDAPLFWVFSANRVTNLPPELMRRGRLDEIFAISVPSSSERCDVLKIHLSKRGVDVAAVGDLTNAVDNSEGYVPAELEQAVKDELIEAFTAGRNVSGAGIAEQLAQIKPLSRAFAEDFAAMQKWAEDNARPASVAAEKRVRATVRRRSEIVVAKPFVDVG